MGRLPRAYIENILYYVTSQGGHGEEIFICDSDYQEYIALLDKYKKQYGFKFFSYVLLPKHLHLLIELRNNVGISSIMHDINSLYTKNFNSRYGRKGHLFQERFKAVMAEKEMYLLPLTRHIHLNPKRAGLVTDPKDYPYSSYVQFLEPGKRDYPQMQEEIQEVFNQLKGTEDDLERYTTAADEESNGFKKDLRKKRILGSKVFVEHIQKIIEENIRQQKKKPLPKKVRIVYMLLGSTAVFILVFAVYFYKQTTAFKSEYHKTLALYDTTLHMLNQQRSAALQANQDVEEYEWKIKLAERALENLKEQHEIDGYAWKVGFVQTSGSQIRVSETDTLSFKGDLFTSSNLNNEGFSNSEYESTILKNGNIQWETVQTNKKGETVSWRGEWDGSVMRGVLNRRYTDGAVRGFSFASEGERIKN